MDSNDVTALVDEGIARIEQPELAVVVRAHRTAVRLEQREWHYGEPGQRYPVWIVWEHAPSETAIGYCLHGFGPGYPWGLLPTAPDTGLGMDSQWYVALEDAARASSAWDGANPPGYEVE